MVELLGFQVVKVEGSHSGHDESVCMTVIKLEIGSIPVQVVYAEVKPDYKRPKVSEIVSKHESKRIL